MLSKQLKTPKLLKRYLELLAQLLVGSRTKLVLVIKVKINHLTTDNPNLETLMTSDKIMRDLERVRNTAPEVTDQVTRVIPKASKVRARRNLDKHSDTKTLRSSPKRRLKMRVESLMLACQEDRESLQ